MSYSSREMGGWWRGALGAPGIAEVEDRALPGDPVGLLAAAPGQRGVEHVQHPLARRAGRVERAAADQRLERPPVRDLRVDALGEVPDRLEGPALLPRGDDRPRGRVADVLDRVQAEADLSLDHGEVTADELTSGGSTSMPISRHAFT